MCVCVCVCVCARARACVGVSEKDWPKIELTVWRKKMPIPLDGIRTCTPGIRAHRASDYTTRVRPPRVSRKKNTLDTHPSAPPQNNHAWEQSNNYLQDRNDKHLQGPPLSRTRGSEKKKEGEATAHRCILRCLTQLAFECGNRTHALNMLRSLEVIMTTHCTVFVRPRLLICLTKHALGLALSLHDCGPQPDVDGVSHDENRRCFWPCFCFG